MLDEKDLIILSHLKSNSKQKTQDISKRTAIPITTVHNRIKKLEKLGIVRNYTVELDYKKVGKNVTALILASFNLEKIRNDKKNPKDIANRMCKNPNVEKLYFVTGKADIVMVTRLKNIDELQKFVLDTLQKNIYIRNLQTLITLLEYSNNETVF